MARDLKRTCDERVPLRCQCVSRNPGWISPSGAKYRRESRCPAGFDRSVWVWALAKFPTGDLPGTISVLAKPWYSPARDFSAPIVRGTTRARGASGTMVRAGTMHDGVRIVLGICQSYISIPAVTVSAAELLLPQLTTSAGAATPRAAPVAI